MTKKQITVGSKVKIIGNYRGFLKDLKDFVGEVKGIYDCNGETRYITYLPALDEYVEPSVKNVQLLTTAHKEVESVRKRSVSQSGSLCAQV